MSFDEFCVKTFHQKIDILFWKNLYRKTGTAEILLGVRVIFRSLSDIFVSFENGHIYVFPTTHSNGSFVEVMEGVLNTITSSRKIFDKKLLSQTK